MSSRTVYSLQRLGNLLVLKASVGASGYQPITVRLLVDTGSSFTTLPLGVLEDLGCRVDQSCKWISIATGSGIIQAPALSAPVLNCLGKQVENFPVVAVELPFNPLVSGLLGMDFLDRCGAIINVKKAEINVQPE